MQNLGAKNYRRVMQWGELPRGTAWQLDGCGGMRVAHGVTLKSDLSDLSDLSDKMVRHVIPRGFARRGVVWLGRKVADGYAGQLDGCGGMRVAHGVTLA